MARKKHTKGERPLVTRVPRSTINTIDRLAKVCGLNRSDFMAAFTQAGLEGLRLRFGKVAA
jgi:uncharacterized protein (DUF1778 family)